MFCVLPMCEVGFHAAAGSSGEARTRGVELMIRRSVGHLRTLNELAKKANADYILHTGDFGFYDESSLERIAEK